jgi:transglutaminase-like putative cysteine protease
VNGFAGGQPNEIGGFLEITRSDAHSWVEVHYQRAGWVRYDPTPPDLRARPEVVLSFGERMRQLASAIELWWFQRVVGFDRADQIHALKRAWIAWRETREQLAEPEDPRPARERSTPGAHAWQEPLRAAGPWLVAALLVGLLFAWRTRSAGGDRRLPPAYRRALALLARRGLVRGETETAREFARSVQRAQPPEVSSAFDALTEGYLAERFGDRPSSDDEEHVRALKRALRARRSEPSPVERPQRAA